MVESDSNEKKDSDESDVVNFEEEFIRIDSLICEHDSLGDMPLRKGESAFQWGNVEKACVALLARVNDIRVAIWYLRACMGQRGVAGLADGIGRLAGIMSLPVEQIQPLALADESPRDIHALHLGWLASPPFLHQCRQARFDGADITLDQLARGDADMAGEREFSAHAGVVLREIRESVLRIDGRIVDAQTPPDLSGVLDLLDRALARLTPTVAPADEGAGHAVVMAGQAPPLQVGAGLATREDVEAALECIAEYFRVHEPSHPAPIFLARIRRMLGAGFEEMMTELYADGAMLAAQLDRPGGVVR